MDAAAGKPERFPLAPFTGAAGDTFIAQDQAAIPPGHVVEGGIAHAATLSMFAWIVTKV
ncbi:hypothetical protein D3C80_2052820 [compost metagenome]